MSLSSLLFQVGGRVGIGRAINAVVGPERAKAFSRLILEGRSMTDYRPIIARASCTLDDQPVPGAVLEIGCWRGHGTRKLLKWAKAWEKEVFACDAFAYDPDPEKQRRIFHRRTSQFDNLVFFDGDSLELPARVPETVRFCLAIVDGCHEEPQVSSDLQFAWDRLNPGGLLLVDDVRAKYPDVLVAVERFEQESGLQRYEGPTWPQVHFYKPIGACLDLEREG